MPGDRQRVARLTTEGDRGEGVRSGQRRIGRQTLGPERPDHSYRSDRRGARWPEAVSAQSRTQGESVGHRRDSEREFRDGLMMVSHYRSDVL
jgi:hypothetical protein